MPPRGGPEGSPPRQGASNLLLSIAPRHDGTAHDTMLEENTLLRNTQHTSTFESATAPIDGDVSVDTLPNTPLLLSNISSPSCQAVAIATPCCEHKRILAVRRSLAAALGTPTCYDRRPPLPFGTWSRVCQFTPKPTSPSGQRFTSFRQAVAIATVCCQQRRIHADRCSCTIQHLEPCQGAQLVAARG